MVQPNVARMYDYYLGGSEAQPEDRAAADQVLAGAPQVRVAVRENRDFLERVVRHLAGLGIRDYLDIGSGLPTQRNVHEILAEAAPGFRVTYVDYDPDVVRRSQELLADVADTACVLGDVRDLPGLFAQGPVQAIAAAGRPVAVLLLAVLNFVADEDDPAALVREVGRRVPPGSLLAFSHGARADVDAAAGIERVYQRASGQAVLRTRAEVAAILGDCTVLPPGITYGAQWRAAAPEPVGDPGTAMTFAALARLEAAA